MTLNEYLTDFIEVYGKSKWSYSTYTNNVARLNNYICATIGNMELSEITTKDLEFFYSQLLFKASPRIDRANCTPSVIRELNKMLSTAFDRAVKWKLIQDNPCKYAVTPAEEHNEKQIWTLDNIFTALDLCQDPILALAIDMAFSCTMREGEILGMTIDRVNMNEGYVFIDRQIQRIKEEYIDQIGNKKILYCFPKQVEDSTSILALIKPKTESSIRKVYMRSAVKCRIEEQLARIERNKRNFGNEYHDHGLLVCFANGDPIEPNKLSRNFRKFVRSTELPQVDFHSLRHSSITYKLKATKGNLKAVQGDAGHAQLRLISEVYSHILDEDRKDNATLLENLIDKEKHGNAIISSEPTIDYMKLEKILKTEEGRDLISALLAALNI